jgi:4-amino-4-deoxy-L-arabinose transferase-like glycosyltransferase
MNACLKRFWIIFYLSLVIKGFFFYRQAPFPYRFYTPDSLKYEELARNLLEHGDFAAAPEKKTGNRYPETIRTPLYPAFLAAILYLSPEEVPFEYITAFVQILLSCWVCGLVYILSYKLFNPSAALVAGFLSALDLTSSTLANRLLSDTLFVFLFFCCVFLFITGMQNGKTGRLSAAGLFCALAALTRPIGLYAVFIFTGFFVYKRNKSTFYNGILFLLPFLLLTGLWTIRNYLRTGSPVFSTQTSIFFLDAASDIKSQAENLAFDRANVFFRQKIREEHASQTGKTGLTEWAELINGPAGRALCRKTFREQFHRYPRAFLRSYSTQLLRLIGEPDHESYVWSFSDALVFRFQWTWEDIGEIIENKHGLTLAMFTNGLLLFLLWGGFAYGAITAFPFPEERGWSLLLMGIILYFTLITPMSHIEMRYRMPLIPFLSIGAGYGISKLSSPNKE